MTYTVLFIAQKETIYWKLNCLTFQIIETNGVFSRVFKKTKTFN